MNKIDFEFYELIKKLELLTTEEIYLNIKNKYLQISEEIKNNIENFLNNFSFWGKLSYKDNCFEEIENVSDFFKQNLDNLVKLYEDLKDYKSKKTLLAILMNYYYYDFNILNEVKNNCYKHYFDLDLVKSDKQTIFIDVGSYIGDSIEDFLDCFNDEYNKIYCYEVTDSSLAILKDKFTLNKNIIIKNKALYDKNTTLNLNISNIDNSANLVIESQGEIAAVKLDEDIKDKVGIIKMDIEGSEQKALMGAQKHIKNDTPTLLISVYHGFEDLIKIPQMIKKINNNYDFYLRYYGGNIFPTEIVLIAIKKDKDN